MHLLCICIHRAPIDAPQGVLNKRLQGLERELLLIGDGNPQEDVHKRNSFPQNSWIGLYTTGILDDDSIDITQGVLLENGGSATWTFDFWLAPGSILNESPSIQVGYFNYDETRGGRRGGKIFFTQMSQTVPEPSTLILLLSGTGLLAGAAGFRRKMK